MLMLCVWLVCVGPDRALILLQHDTQPGALAFVNLGLQDLKKFLRAPPGNVLRRSRVR